MAQPARRGEARANTSTVVAALDGDPAFHTELDTTCGELVALRAAGGQALEACGVEAALTASTPW